MGKNYLFHRGLFHLVGVVLFLGIVPYQEKRNSNYFIVTSSEHHLGLHIPSLQSYDSASFRDSNIFGSDWYSENVTKQQQQQRDEGHRRYLCPKCSKSYKYLGDMKKHLRFQCGQEPRFECPYCQKRTKVSSNMYAHVRAMHSDQPIVTAEPYQSRRDNLNAMEDTEENTYLYVDSSHRQETAIAPISATRWPDNVVAQGSVTRKKFHCPRCNSGYTRLSDMKTHCQFQCGKEPRYQCPYCTKKAKFSSNMYVHVRRMHKDKKLQIIDLYKQLSRVRC
ncbi:Zinc finger protein Xfin [Trachymyrmex septentrionalis]|uniref:Zinc finger protein Xfin n=1 Tax=Trachymyrmex septentrionalis TaxID=34720 RepID=A0A195EUX9_9HYME|nr:Zinc finger protein Xfin [Trachymyrmex septentrionalis]